MSIPFYYNPATNELELTADPSPLRTSLGKRFGLNEISTARETLSPTKSYKDGGRIGLKEGTPTLGDLIIDFIVKNNRQPKPSEILQLKEKLKTASK